MEKYLSATGCGLVMVTVVERSLAEAIAKAIVEAQLAACVTLLPAHSIYTWQGKINQEDQWQLLIKTDLNKFADLETKLREIHSDEVPEIIALPIVAGFAPYLQWISDNVP